MASDNIKKIILLPVYNESSTVKDELEKLYPQGDLLLIINDGSTDESGSIIKRWMQDKNKIIFIDIYKNSGKSAALQEGFFVLLKMKEQSIVNEEDLIVITDADGQLPSDIIEESVSCFIDKKLDMLIGARDFSIYPFIKRLGNYLLSYMAALTSGYPFKDTQCGYRIINIKGLEKILPYYNAKRYACEQELSILSVLLGLKVNNDFVVKPVYYRSNSTLRDAFQITLDSFITYFRVKKSGREKQIRQQTNNISENISISLTMDLSRQLDFAEKTPLNPVWIAVYFFSFLFYRFIAFFFVSIS